MGEIEGTYRVLETSGSRLGGPNHTGVSTLEPGQSLSSAMAKTSAKLQEKALAIKVKLLDNAIEILHVEPKCYGQILLTEVFKHLNLIESDYFGLEFQNVQSYWIWLEPMKPIVKQIRRPKNTMLRLAVKFFPPDPGQLQEEYTRYLFALQIKRDLAEERLLCSDNTTALLTSHLLQSEIGDYEETADREHLKISKYVPNQDSLQEKIIEYHRQHIGQTPAESDFQVLEIARKLEMYGIKFHLASDREGTKIHLAVSHLGVLVFQGNTKINTFNWSKVRKLSFKRKRFLIKLHPEVHGSYQDTLEFLLGSRDECKNFWKICVEYHTFFRLFDQPKPKAKAVFFSRGSSFRYSGRTQRQLVDYVKDSGMKKQPYERRHSKVKISTQTLNKDLPKQSISFTEGLRVSGSPCSTNASFYSAPTSSVTPADLPVCMDSNSSFMVSKAPSVKSPVAERSSVTSAEEADKQTVQLQGSPILHSFQGLLEDSSPLSPSSLKSSLSLNPTFQVSLSPTGQGSSPLLSPVLGDAGYVRVEDEEETKQQKLVRTNNIQKQVPTDRAYFIAKEILATERTYVKDLEVITVWFRSAVIKERAMPETLTTLLFSNIDPIYEFHRGFLREIEQRLALWEGATGAHEKGNVQRIGDIMLKNMHSLKAFTGCLQKHDEILTELEKATRCLRKLEMVYREFELQKVCYLPLNTFFLKPIQRLIYYKLVLGRLCRYYMPGHPDYPDCKSALRNISEMTLQLQNSLLRLENFQKLTELQHDLVGIDNLIIPGREFIREGCLYKLTKKGFQQRMFFLFSDMLLYTSKGVTGTNHFKIHGQLPLHGMLLIVLDPPVEETDNEWSVPHCFTIYSVPKTIVVAASTRLEMGKWMDDLSLAIELVKSSDKAVALLDGCVGGGSNRPSGEVSGEQESEEEAHSSHSSLDRQSLHRANTTMHVCWYRNTSVSMADHSVAVELPPRSLLGQGPKANTITHVCWYRNHSLSLTDYLCMIQNQLSGYLLRKFKNSSGWQKLWVVFTNFCLFFYKTHQDDYPLASLPLLGYTISVPGQADGLHKDFVFKLQFKSHIYFFRAESKYTFERWMEVIKRATNSPGRSSQTVAGEDRDSRTN